MAVFIHRREWTVFVCAFLVFMMAGLFAVSLSWRAFSHKNASVEHPIPILMANAKVNFTQRLEKQSKTLAEAVAEYKRRYGRNPPRGFGDWWDFAKEHNFLLVDEFDAINEDLAPFWSLGGRELRQRAYQMGQLPSIDLVRIENGNVSTVQIEKPYNDREHRSWGFRKLLEKFQHKLPDMDFPINGIAEGRILVPWERVHSPHITRQGSSTTEANILDDFTPDWRGEGSVWEAFRHTCPPDSQARQLYSSYRDPRVFTREALLGQPQDSDDPSPFVERVPEDVDFCMKPWAHYMQGHFLSDWRTVPALFPVLTPAKANGYADIRIPSYYYFGGLSRYTYGWDPVAKTAKDVDDMEVPWEQKSDLIFWRGATTGGGSTPPGHSQTYQRQRFLRMAHKTNAANLSITHASPLRPDKFISTIVLAKDVNEDIMDVAFVRVAGKNSGGATELREHHRFADSVPLGKHWSYKYLIDLDGMSYSGRFMALLASDSAVLKSTVYKEYYSDWIQPWLHFIPISSSYSEIYNIHAYFSGPSAATSRAANVTVRKPAVWEAVRNERDRELRQIAEAGRQWKRTIGRQIDMEVYVYRLCLEYARLWADDRDSMDFMFS